jgi:hypothetical protein
VSNNGTALTQCCVAVEVLVADLASRISPERLLKHVEDNGWTFLHHNAIRTAQKWELRGDDGEIARVEIPLPTAPRGAARTTCMRRAVETVMNAEGWDLRVLIDVTLPEGLQ